MGTQRRYGVLVRAAGIDRGEKVGRIDMTFGFLASLFVLKLTRILYLGDRFEVLLHQFDQALIVFAFYDYRPKTTPNARTGRLAFAFSADHHLYLQHWHFMPSAPVYALAAVAVVPIMDRVFPALRFRWNRGNEKVSVYQDRLRAPTSAGAFHETQQTHPLRSIHCAHHSGGSATSAFAFCASSSQRPMRASITRLRRYHRARRKNRMTWRMIIRNLKRFALVVRSPYCSKRGRSTWVNKTYRQTRCLLCPQARRILR